VVKKLTPRLIGGISNANADISNECMELTSDLVVRFGAMMTADDHTKMLEALKPQLLSNKPAVRRRAKDCIGFLAPSLSEALFSSLISFLVEYAGSSQVDHQRSCIQAIGSVSRQCGSRVGPFLATIVPLFDQICAKIRAEEEQEDWMFDLLENIIQVFDTFVLRCPREVAPHIDVIQAAALVFVKYDPYLADDSDEDEEEEDEDDEDGSDSEEDDDSDDDEDTSYKVRRAAAKCIQSLFNSRSDLINQFYSQVADPVVKRFKERLEPVKLDIFDAFTALVRQTAIVNKVSKKPAAAQSPDAMDVDDGAGKVRVSESIAALTALVPKLVRATAKQLGDKRKKAAKARIGTFKLMSELFRVVPGAMSEENISKLMPGILRSVSEKGSASTLKVIYMCLQGTSLEPVCLEYALTWYLIEMC